jgi:hypothetical protein
MNNNPYSTADIITVMNIDDEDFEFEYDRSSGNYPYVIPAGEIRRFPRFLAQHAVKHLIDKILNRKGIKTNDIKARSELATQVVIGEETFQQTRSKSNADITKEEIDRLNKPSDLEAVLGKKRAMTPDEIALRRTFKGGNELSDESPAILTPPAPAEHFAGLNKPAQTVAGPVITTPSIPTVAPVIVTPPPTVPNPPPDDNGNIPGEVDATLPGEDTTQTPMVKSKNMPSRSQLADFAKNTLKMSLDAKTTKYFQEAPIEDLVKELDYPMQ